jgi:hypothetical protein
VDLCTPPSSACTTEGHAYVDLAVYAKVFACPSIGDLLNSLESWIFDWKITIDVSVLFVKTVTCIQQPQPAHFTEELVKFVEIFPYLETAFDSQQIWYSQKSDIKKCSTETLYVRLFY